MPIPIQTNWVRYTQRTQLQGRHIINSDIDGKSSKVPLWALVSFGAYLLFKLGWGVVTFRDVPDAYHELMKEVDMARKELREKGVDVD